MPLFTRFLVTEALDTPYTSIKWNWSDLAYVRVTFRTDPGLEYDVVFTTTNPRPVGDGEEDDGGRYYEPTDETTTNIEFRLDSVSIEKVKDLKVKRGDYSSYTGPFNVAGTGDSFRVFATVVKIIQIFAAKMQPDEMTFSASERSREKLYDRFAHNVDRGLPEYRADIHQYTGGGKHYTFTRKSSPGRITKSQTFPGSSITVVRPSTDPDAYPTTHIPATPTKPPVAQEAVTPVYAQIIEALGSPYPLGRWSGSDGSEQNMVSFTAANNMTYEVTMTPEDNQDSYHYDYDDDEEGDDDRPAKNWEVVTVEFRLGTNSYNRAVDAEAERAAKAGVAQRYFGSYGVARTGDAFRVFATIVAVVKELVRRKEPEVIKFTASEHSRRKLYDRFVADVGRALPNYEGHSTQGAGGTTYYEFHRKGSFAAQNARDANEIRPRQDTFNRTGSRDSLHRTGTSVTIPGPLRHDATFPTTHMPAAQRIPTKPTQVTEAFNAPYPFEWSEGGYNQRQAATFTTDAGLKYVATFHPDWFDDEDIDGVREWEFQFEIEYESMRKLRQQRALPVDDPWSIGPYDIAGTGDAFRVFATMIAIMKDFVQKEDPPEISFIATEKSRKKLYDRFAKEIKKAFPSYDAVIYKGNDGEEGESHHYVFKRREDAPTVGGRTQRPVTEALSSPYSWSWRAHSLGGWVAVFKGKYEYRVSVVPIRGPIPGGTQWGVRPGEWDVVFSPTESSYNQMMNDLPPENEDPEGILPSRPYRMGPYDMTQAGDSFRVMSTVVAVVLDFIKRERPALIQFTAGSDEPGRLKLYKRFVQKIQTVSPNYIGKQTMEAGRPNSYTSFKLIRKDA